MDHEPETTANEAELLAQAGDLAGMPGYLFRILESKSKSLFLEAVGGGTLTTRQFAVLYVLLRHGAMIQADLAELTTTDKSTLGEMLRRMAERGLLAIVTGDDKRSMVISITGAGRALVLDAIPRVIRAQQALIEPLPEEYRLIFLKCLQILAQADFSLAPAADD